MTHILLIEDNKDIRENTVETLELAGFKVAAAVDGVEGLSMIISLQPQIILCDIVMPRMNGIEVFQNVKAVSALSSIPFIFLSAKTQKKEIQDLMEQGADGYLVKPFEPSELLSIVRWQLDKVVAH
jgi:CheY-like chemotaxis protein